MAVFHCLFRHAVLENAIIRPKDADGIANSVGPDQTAPFGAAWPEVIKLFSCSIQLSIKF